jgi:hypothetical protein
MTSEVIEVIDDTPETIEIVEILSPPEPVIEIVDTGISPFVEFIEGAGLGGGSAGGGTTIFKQSETPIGLVNGVNAIFTTINSFSTIRVFLNGLGLKVNLDYAVSGLNTFTMQQPPVTGDILTVDYTI